MLLFDFRCVVCFGRRRPSVHVTTMSMRRAAPVLMTSTRSSYRCCAQATMLGIAPRYRGRGGAGPSDQPPAVVNAATVSTAAFTSEIFVPCPQAEDVGFNRELNIQRGFGRGFGRGGRGRGRGFSRPPMQPRPTDGQARGWSQGSAAVRPTTHEGGWQCPCGAKNFKGRTSCFKCRAAKDAKAQEIPAVGGRPAAVAPATPWRCSCGMENEPTRRACGTCFSPRP
jgi:hypothetical protein